MCFPLGFCSCLPVSPSLCPTLLCVASKQWNVSSVQYWPSYCVFTQCIHSEHISKQTHQKLLRNSWAVEYACKTFTYSATGMLPFRCMFGFQPLISLFRKVMLGVSPVQDHICCCWWKEIRTAVLIWEYESWVCWSTLCSESRLQISKDLPLMVAPRISL